jgi:hypothetical protein
LSPTLFINALLDTQNGSWIYQTTASNLFQTFWGRFGWGNISLSSICYNVLKWITVLSLLSAPFGLWSISRMKSISWKLAIAWVGLAMLVIWLSVFIRGLPSLWGQIYIPTARYGYPAIIPTMMFLSAGWCAGLPRPQWLKLSPYLYFVGFLVLDLISIITIVSFYKGI